MLNKHKMYVVLKLKDGANAGVVMRENTKEIRNRKIIKKYNDILKRLGDVRFLTPRNEIMEEIAVEFHIRATTVSRIITSYIKSGK